MTTDAIAAEFFRSRAAMYAASDAVAASYTDAGWQVLIAAEERYWTAKAALADADAQADRAALAFLR
jgi:predicted metal-dependent hydrolase